MTKQSEQSPVGSLTVVGTGIKAIAHVTVEADSHIRSAGKLFYLVADTVIENWLMRTNASAESLYRFYGPDKDRSSTYEEIIQCLVNAVQAGEDVCCALYGHPGVFSYPGREAVKRLRELGHQADVLPGVSAEDCIFADLGIDPGVSGCQSFEATDFLLRKRRFDPHSLLILWQFALIAVQVNPSQAANRRGLLVLRDYLLEFYDETHRVIVYQAAQYPLCKPVVHTVAISDLVNAPMTPICTLVIPPSGESESDPEMLQRLGIKQSRR
jgi:uncharacterized protein YabN with tetrapyrrole methylase and pyrophosphatase domain